MTTTILLDLDDTLLGNDIDTFLPAYLQALSRFLSLRAEPEQFIATLLAATRKMEANQRPDCTLKEVFDSAFYPTLHWDAGQVRADIDRFYAEVFPTLQGLTRPIPEAVRFVESALARGCRLVVATNPLFPRTAILQRLAWAGLPLEKVPFELVASYETFHFAKPSPAFFTEILARLGWPDGPVVMVGNDPHRDIGGARQAGLSTFWIENQKHKPLGEAFQPDGRGSLASLLSWLDSQPAENLQPDFTSPAALLAVLRSTPAALLSSLIERSDEAETEWTARPASGEWSITEVLCHLRDVEREVNLPRLQQVIEENNPFLPGKDTDPWAEERLYLCQNGPEALHSFIASRLQLLDFLDRLQPQDWQRPARHAIFGPTRFAELVTIIAGHDRLHIQQIHKGIS